MKCLKPRATLGGAQRKGQEAGFGGASLETLIGKDPEANKLDEAWPSHPLCLPLSLPPALLPLSLRPDLCVLFLGPGST